MGDDFAKLKKMPKWVVPPKLVESVQEPPVKPKQQVTPPLSPPPSPPTSKPSSPPVKPGYKTVTLKHGESYIDEKIIPAEKKGIEPIPEKPKVAKTITEKGEAILKAKGEPKIEVKILGPLLTAGPEYAYESATGPTWKPGDPIISPRLQQMIKHKESVLESKWERGDVLGLSGEVIGSPLVMVPLTHGLGWGIGAFKTTAIGSKALLVSKGLTKAGKPLYTITPSTLLEGGLVGYGTYETGKSIVDDPGRTLFHLAATMPFIIPSYKWGYHSGMGYMQRKAALSRVSGLDRVRQKGLYEAMDVAGGLHEPPSMGEPVFDLSSIQRISPKTAVTVGKYLKSEQRWGMLGGRPRVGGSASARMQIGEFFRSDTLPKGFKKWALKRQTTPRPLIGKTPPLDIDLLVYSRLGGLKRASPLRKSHVVDIHTYKVGEHLWGGKTQLPSTTGAISTGKVKLLSVREQFLRKSISILPSEKKVTGYRAYKDIPDWYDLGDVLSFQKGGGKLRGAMDKVIHPSRYPVPKRTFSEKIISRLGVKPFTETTPKGDVYYNLPKYPSYPSYGIGLLYARYPTYKTTPKSGGYKTPPYKPKIISTGPPPLVPPYKPKKEKTKPPIGPPSVPYKTIIQPSRKTPPTRPYKTPYPPTTPPPSIPPPIKTGYPTTKIKRVISPRITLDIYGETKPVKPPSLKRFWGRKYKTRYWEDIKGVRLPDIFKKVI